MNARRIVALGLSLLLLVGGGWWLWQTQRRARATENALEASYQRAFFDLLKNMENLDTLLGKSLASGSSGQRIMSLTSVWHEAENARANLANMPVGMVNMMRSQQYLAQLGDYCYVLAEKQARGLELEAEEWQQLAQLHEQTREIHAGLREIMAGIGEEGFQWRSFASLSRNKKLTPRAQSIADGFSKLDEKLRDQAPTLTYDGPFSDHIEEQEPKGLTGERISEAQAREIALEFLDLAGEAGYKIGEIRKTRGRIPAYSLTIEREGENRGQIALDVSQQGGHVVWMLNSRLPRESKLSLTEALARAEDFLAQRGLARMVPTGTIREGNRLSVSFAAQEDGVIIYPDLIKVTVALDDGEIIAYDAMGFLMAHHKRDLPQPKLTPEEAEKKVSRQMEVQRTRLAVIPMSNLEEKLCYEVRGKVNGDTYLVYINAVTGDEEKILQLVETEAGTRAM
ncbi:MAG TPA: germination protein YpeB [Firmicutes bacterium]|nr:germination protein YpeB [Bacillota bacterium]